VTAEAGGGFEPAALRKWIPWAVVVAILLGVGAYALARGLASPVAPEQPARAADDFVRFRDPAAGFSIALPASWRRVAPSDPQVRLLAEGDDSSMSVRTVDLETEVDQESLVAAKRLTDALVSSAGPLELVRPPSQVTLGGLPGYLYLYTYTDAATGGRGAHAHYFLFRGRTLITLVFETVPAEQLARLAPLFDRIGETLRPI
jgi:hypothetical protein